MIASTLFAMLSTVASGQANEIDAAAFGVRYELLAGSTLTDLLDLSPGNPVHPIRGTFVLRSLPTAGPFPSYEISRLHLRTLESSPVFVVNGSGFYRTFGPFPNGSQEMDLVVGINQNAPNIIMTSGLVPQGAPFPTIEVEVSELPTSNDHLFVLKLIAEPLREIRFSTEFGLTSAQLGPVSDGDVLSTSGHIQHTNTELTELLGIMPIVPDIGLDALGMTPATKSVLFSAEVDIFSESLGWLQHGDLLNEHGFVAATNQQLTSAFGPKPIVPDAGLAAYHVDLASGEQWFGLEQPLFSETLGIMLQPGDLLSDAGYVVRTNAELLDRFEITDPDPAGYGLDAVSRLPNGTILFSVEQGFVDDRFGPVGHGDLLSDNGHLIRRNLDLVWPFEPFEDLDDFGLDALQAGSILPALGTQRATQGTPVTAPRSSSTAAVLHR